jgi:hypothetical protein
MVYVEELNSARLMVGIPTNAGDVADLLIPMFYGMRMPKVQFAFVHGCYIDQNRNSLVRACYDESYTERLGGEFTHLLLTDADTIPMNTNAVEKLLLADKGVISGILTFKNIPSNWMLWKWGDRENHLVKRIPIAHSLDPMNLFPQYQNVILEVDAVGFGFILIKREVFEAVGLPWFESYHGPRLQYIGEDVMFCKKAQDAGYKIYAHTGVMCSHKMGRYYYPQKSQDVFDEVRKYYDLVLKDEYKSPEVKPDESTV